MRNDLLKGKSIVVTRASHQSADLIESLEVIGADVVPAPAIAIVPPLDGGQPLDDALLRLERFSWVAFTSANAVAAMTARAERRGVRKKFSGLRIAAVGPATASRVVAEFGREPDLVPVRTSGQGLAEVFPSPTADDRILIPAASEARTELRDGLASKGWDVHQIAAYRTVHPTLSQDLLSRVAAADVVTFTSPSAVIGHLKQTAGVTAPLDVAIGDTPAQECITQGLKPQAIAATQSIESLVDAVVSIVEPA